VLCGVKLNSAPLPRTLTFHIEGVQLGKDSIGRLVWDFEDDRNWTSSQVLSGASGGEQGSKTERAQVLLQALLDKAGAEGVLKSEIEKLATDVWLIDMKTVTRAKEKIGNIEGDGKRPVRWRYKEVKDI